MKRYFMIQEAHDYSVNSALLNDCGIVLIDQKRPSINIMFNIMF